MPTDGEYGAAPAEAIAPAAGACPPILVVYRIYPEMFFAEAFGNPPPTVQT